jgi:hypothetical protein
MLSEIVLLAMLTSLVDDWRFFDDRGALNGVRKVGSNANKKLSGRPFALNTKDNMPRRFLSSTGQPY